MTTPEDDGEIRKDHHGEVGGTPVSTGHGGNGYHEQPASAADARPVVLLRSRPGRAAQSAAVVHLAPLPSTGTGAVSALCGALLPPEDYQPATPGQGLPCLRCAGSHLPADPPSAPGSGEIVVVEPALPDPTGATTATAAALSYRLWRWPVTLRGDRVWLDLDGDTVVALLLPSPLAAEVTALLTRRRCPPPVFAHPQVPEHRVLLCGERYEIGLPFSHGVHRVSGSVLLPPSPTPCGPLTWTHLPQRESLKLCREIDAVAAVWAVRNNPPPASGPLHL